MTTAAIEKLLNNFNSRFIKLHKNYEDAFWLSYMGDHSKNKAMTAAMRVRDEFNSNPKNLTLIKTALKHANPQQTVRLNAWLTKFSKHQLPAKVLKIKNTIAKLENIVHQKLSSQQEGYIDPETKKFVSASKLKMRDMMRTNDNEEIRRACFDALQKLSVICVDEYVKLVELRNSFAHTLGFKDFYAYKTQTEESMDSSKIYAIFDKIYRKTKFAFKNIRKIEKTMPGLRKPWNYSYLLSGDFAKEEDQYFQFDKALELWGRSFTALGIRFNQDQLTLDLLDRPGKYANGFCHWPVIVHFNNGKRVSGKSNFTCNAVPGQIGSGVISINTLFHEGGHAAHYLNSQQTESCMNTEYPPASTAWAETQSMFLDSVSDSIEWRTRYAVNKKGDPYPFELFKRKLHKLHNLAPLDMMGITSIIEFERIVYQTKNLTTKKVIEIAKKTYKKYTDASVDSTALLSVPHIYSWESACSYHGYGLAELAVAQWRKYFFNKYGYIVDNPNIGKEMAQVWALGSSTPFDKCVEIATGEKLSPQSYIENITRSLKDALKMARGRINRLKKIRTSSKIVDLNAKIVVVDGKTKIADNSNSFAKMVENFSAFIQKR